MPPLQSSPKHHDGRISGVYRLHSLVLDCYWRKSTIMLLEMFNESMTVKNGLVRCQPLMFSADIAALTTPGELSCNTNMQRCTLHSVQRYAFIDKQDV